MVCKHAKQLPLTEVTLRNFCFLAIYYRRVKTQKHPYDLGKVTNLIRLKDLFAYYLHLNLVMLLFKSRCA